MGVPIPTDDNYYDDNADDDDCYDSDTGTGDSTIDDDNRVNTTEIIQLLCEFGEPGGYFWKNYSNHSVPMNTTTATIAARHNRSVPAKNNTRWEGDSEDDNTIASTTTTTPITELEQWLNGDDDEYDEGTVVVIGRTQFFTGEMRQYVGMPATSAFLGGVSGSSNDVGD